MLRSWDYRLSKRCFSLNFERRRRSPLAIYQLLQKLEYLLRQLVGVG